MRRSFSSLLATLLLVIASTTTLLADTGKTIFYNVTTDEAWRAGMALGQANKALDTGYMVVIFLNVRAIDIASKKAIQDTLAIPNKSTQQLLKAAMSKGAKVIICPMCLKRNGLTMEDLIDGVEKGGAEVTLKAMTADNTVVISY